jgi:Ca-activated chloride channel family protein
MNCASAARLFCALPIAALLISLATLTGCCKKEDRANARPPRQDAAIPKSLHNQDMLTGESYEHRVDNPFMLAANHPLSTFSIDVDTASYSNVRRFLKEGQLPPKDAVRIEELINYFHYDYPQPRGEHPIGIHTEVAKCPWKSEHLLVRIALQGKTLSAEEMPPRNFVFLVDTSGSMDAPNRLPLLKQALGLLTKQLTHRDRVAIVSYAGSAEMVLGTTPGDQHEKILAAIDRLNAYGSTNGGGGIVMAYRIAEDNFIKGGANRVILGTDGDFNVGVTGAELIRLIDDKRKTGVFLSVLGFGMGNLKDQFMEQLAQHGNGQYAYIDSFAEARKVFVHDIANLVPIAKDVKLQVEFNPRHVQAYRLIGYENRLLAHQDFNDDTKDAGDMGAGHTVTALYEIVPPGVPLTVPGVDPLKYHKTPQLSKESQGTELLTVKVRYIPPEKTASRLLSVPVQRSAATVPDASTDFRFAAAVAEYGMLLRDSPYKGEASYASTLKLAQGARGPDARGYRAQFVELVQTTERLARTR